MKARLWKCSLCMIALSGVDCSYDAPTCTDLHSCPGIDGGADAQDALGSDGSTCDSSKPPGEDACVIEESYGVFVSPNGSDASGAGTRAAPYKTLAKAIASASGKRVYACATGGSYDEMVTIGASVSLFGGFDCSSWAYTTSTTAQLKPSAPGIPLTVKASDVTIEDVRIEATDATDPGASSIALFASNATNLTLHRVTLKAGKGQKGADAAPASNYDPTLTQNDPKIMGHGTTDATGGAEQVCANLCVNGTHATGGKGGNGATASPAGDGDPGNPSIMPVDPPTATGLGGAGETVANGACSNGKKGSNRQPALGGAGAARAGTLSANGWTPANGADGATGGPGQGGGGGGGGISKMNLGGGGGGGCGGCGGAGGPGGKGGGSSFALLGFQSTVTLDACTLIADMAGAGGKGAEGQVGQIGGAGGTQASLGCPGGTGGLGGTGGGGGGGAGGVSVAIGYVGAAPAQMNGTTPQVASIPTTGGAPGTGGSPAATKGKDGMPQAVMSLE